MKPRKPRPSQSDGVVRFGEETADALAWLADVRSHDISVAEANAQGYATSEQIGQARKTTARNAWALARNRVLSGDWEMIWARGKGSHRVQVFRPVRR